jgi:hypothetical protein
VDGTVADAAPGCERPVNGSESTPLVGVKQLFGETKHCRSFSMSSEQEERSMCRALLL